MERFASYCRFEPETGCVVWTGSTSKGRGKHAPYPQFWFEGKTWWGHRWAGRYIHGLDIDGYHTDHCCPHLPQPNTLCVQHLQAKTLRENVELQHERRKRFIYLQVGLINYPDVYGPDLGEPVDTTPFFTPPEWLATIQGATHGHAYSPCPF